MTVIVGIEHRGRVWIGGDSAGTDESGSQHNMLEPRKVFRVGDVLMGCAGSLRMAQVLAHGLKLPARDAPKSDESYLAIDFIAAVRELLQTAGCLCRQESGQDHLDGTLLIAYRGKLYTVDSDCNVNRNRKHFDAVGCGGRYARGALAVMTEPDPAKRVLAALRATCSLNSDCRPPFVVLCDPPVGRRSRQKAAR